MMLRKIDLRKSRSISIHSIRLVAQRFVSIDYLTSSIPKPSQPPSIPNQHRSTLQNDLPPKDITKAILTPLGLSDHFRHEIYASPSSQQLTQSQAFFNRSKCQHEWSIGKFNEIPDIKYNLLRAQKEEKHLKMESYGKTQYHETSFHSKKTFGIKPELLKPLPEVLLMGHTNTGKSSLVNTLLLNQLENKSPGAATQHAYVSKRAGYTKTLSSFNVGNKLRIIDSPGYGEFGDLAQGELVMDYIRHRKVLRRAFILIDAVKGFQEEDLVLIDSLIEEGVPFEIVFTKVDEVIRKHFVKLRLLSGSRLSPQQRFTNMKLVKQGNESVIKYFEECLEETGVKDLVTLPKLLFNNGETNKYINMRYGYKEIRTAILQSCGLLT